MNLDRIRYSGKIALGGLKTNKTRSALTILGIVIGVMAIIMVVSLGEGAKNLILGQIQSIGSRVLAVHPGRQPKGPTDILATLTDSLKQKDLDMLSRKENVPHAESIMPTVFGSETASYEGQTYKPTIIGGTELMADIYNAYPDRGRNISEDDVRAAADVVVLGSKVADEIAPNTDLLGERIKIKGRNFLVVGLLPQKGGSAFFNFDEIAMVPYTTAQRYIFGIKYYNRIVIQADKEENVQITADDINATMRASHDITDPEKDDFSVETQADALETVGTIMNTLTMFLALVAAISLLVGGIGIMNIMLVSVTERTREVGLRKALGATNKNILSQFLFEAVILTGVGGIAGIALGTTLSFITSYVLSNVYELSWEFSFPWKAALLGIAVSSAAGLLFGLYPARKAAAKNPIDALRYE